MRVYGDFLLAMLLALLSASLNYRYGAGVQIEQLPLILHQLDPDYLVNDFFVATGAEFGPRIYFVQLLAWICKLVPLHWAYFLLAVLSNLALVLVTQWAAYRIIGADRLGAALAAVMVLGLASFHLGDATQIRYEVFQPASLAIPGALWAIGLGLCGRPVAAAVVAAIASLPHPLYGAEGGGIALATAFFVLLFPQGESRQYIPAWRAAFTRTGIGAVILGGFLALVWWLPYRGVNAGQVLPTSEFFEILAGFRAPHHYYASYFRTNDFVSTTLFVLAVALAFERWSPAVARLRSLQLLIPVILVFAGCIAGALFTEIWPVRAILTLQPFRLLSVVKWLGLLLLSWVLARYWQQPPTARTRPLVALSLMSTGVTHPLASAVSLGLIRFQPWTRTGIPEALWVAGLAIAVVPLWVVFGAPGEMIFLIAAYGVVTAFVLKRRLFRPAAVLASLLLVVALFFNRGSDPAVDIPAVSPQFELADHHDIEAQTARAVAEYTPVDAVLLAPPQYGLLRIIGERALVVDFKSIPFQDRKMREWRERMRIVYGNVKGGGFAAASALEENYRMVTDGHLLMLAERFGASHALLYAETVTRLPVLYENGSYRLVSLRANR
ncbi:MAG TPA: DUF6798 domain-containing protein [Gammaproteobacteria bacterium]|nr:DUF6798 domain-containing protein [Gammaproteobacteria bacterium]